MYTVEFEDSTIVDIEDSVLALLRRYEQKHSNSKESGGVLVGKKIIGEEHYIISAASQPTVHDKRFPFLFIRSKKGAQPFIDRLWKESDGTVNYLGEWHTHLEENPTPSKIDLELISQIVDDQTSLYGKVFLIIVGQNNTLFFGLADKKCAGKMIAHMKTWE